MPEIVLQPVVDSIDTVPESHREYYEARDGKHYLAKPIKLEDTGGLKSALDKTRTELDELRKAAAKQKEPSPEIQEKLKQLEQFEEREALRKGEYESLIKKNEEKYTVEGKKKDERITVLEESMKLSTRETAATTAINALRGDVEALMPHVLPHLKAVEDSKRPGKFTVVVIDPKDPDTARLGPKGQEMTVEELVAEKREHAVLSKLFDASPASGGGGTGTRFTQNGSRVVKVTEEERKNPQKWAELKESKKKGEIDRVIAEDGRVLM